MSTTTLRLPDDLKASIEKLAAESGKTSHGYVIDALQRQIEQDLARSAFHAEALTRLEEFKRTGMSVPWSEVRRFLTDRVAGRQTPRPKARKFTL
jgi:predicted transcriptional regulator